MRTLIGLGIISWLVNNANLVGGWASLAIIGLIVAMFQDLKELGRD